MRLLMHNLFILSRNLKLFFKSALLCLVMTFSSYLAFGQEQAELLKEMQRYLDVAREAGFTEEELKGVTIERNGEVINVWQYIQNELERQKRLEQEQNQASNKLYLNADDVREDLRDQQPSQIRKLRQKLILTGKQEK